MLVSKQAMLGSLGIQFDFGLG